MTKKTIARFLSLTVAAALILPAAAFAQSKIYTKDYVGKMQTYSASYEDTLVHLAREYGLGFVEMRAANPKLDPWLPGAGAKVVLPTQHLLPDAPREGIVINLPEMRLYYFDRAGQAPLSYAISPGREGLRTPVGSTSIQRKVEGPTWRPTARMLREDPNLKPVYPPGPDNPLGTHALYLGWPEYLIHGTDKPYAIGRQASSGCIRMYPEAIRDLYPRVPNGTKVTVVDQPVKVGWIDDKMYVEVSPTQEQGAKFENTGEIMSYEITAADMKRITAKAGAHSDKIDWEAVRRAVREHSGYPVEVLDQKSSGRRSAPQVNAEKSDNVDDAASEIAAEIEPKKNEAGKSKEKAELTADVSSAPRASIRVNN